MNSTIHKVIIQIALGNESRFKEYGDFSFVGFDTSMCEDDIFPTAVSMMSEIFRRDNKGFYVDRPTSTRIIVTCRYISVLVAAILKANNIPCRCRAGWAKYLREDELLDHWVNEYWSKKRATLDNV